MYKKGKKSKISFIKKRLTTLNSNWIELFSGESGSGKTWSAISQCESIDPNFDVSKQVVFSFKQFMKVVNSEWFKNLKWRLIIFDEPQTEVSNRKWQSLTNQLLNYLMTTFRHQNIATIFCCPYKDFLDSASMKMVHCETQMVGIDKKACLVKTKPRLQQYNPSMKKYYQHRIQVMSPGGKVIPLTWDYIPKPSKKAIELYEEAKTRFTTQLNLNIERKLAAMGEDDGRKEITPPQKMVLTKLNTMKAQEIADELGVSLRAIYSHRTAALNKGYKMEEFIEDEGNA